MSEITRPRCYFAVFADPYLPGHVSVEAGRFGNRSMPRNMRPDDLVLLYCTSSYIRYAKTVPGYGLVTAVDHDIHGFSYDYLPFRQPLALDFIRFVMTPDDRVRLANIRRQFLFEISEESFRAIADAGSHHAF